MLPSKRDMQLFTLRLTRQCQQCGLSYIELHNLDLSYANLRQTDLHGATFTNVNLNYANLQHANLRYAIFNGVRLKGTQLCGAVLPDPKNPTLASGNFDCTTY